MINFIIDLTPPQVRVIDDNFTSVANDAITDTGGVLVSGTDLMPDGVTPGSGIAKIRLIQTAGQGYSGEEMTFPANPVQESVNFPLGSGGASLPSGDYLAAVTDAAGNVSSSTFHIPPHLSLVLQLDNSNALQEYFTGTGANSVNTWASIVGLGFESGVSVAVKKNGLPFASGASQALLLNGLTDGAYTVTATGASGVQTMVTINRYTFTAAVDTSKPAATLAGDGTFLFNPNIQVTNTFPGTNVLGSKNVTAQLFKAVLDPNGSHYIAAGAALTTCSGSGNLSCAIPPQPAGTYVILAKDANGAISQSFQFRTDFGAVRDYFTNAAYNYTEQAVSPTGANGVSLAVVRSGTLAGKQFFSPGTVTTGIESLLGDSADGSTVHAAPGAVGAALIAPPLNAFDLIRLPDYVSTPEHAGYTGLSVTWAVSAGPDPGKLPAFVPISQTKARVLGDISLNQADMIIENTPLATFPLDLGAYAQWQVTLTANNVVSGQYAPGAVSPITGRVAFLPELAVANVLQGAGTMFQQSSSKGLCKVSATAPNLMLAEVDVVPPSGLNAVGKACSVDPTLIFTTTAAIQISFSTPAVIAAGLDINSVAAYVQPPRGQFTRVPFQMIDRTSGVATAFVGSLALDSTFALFAATAPAGGGIGGGVTPSTAPASFAVVAVASTTVDLSWSANGNPSGVDYAVFYGTAAGAQCVPPTSSFPQTTTTAFEASGLLPGATYQFEVCASGGAGLCTSALQVVTAPPGQGPLAQFQAVACGGGGTGGGSSTSEHGLAIAADAAGKLWEVVDDAGTVGLARYRPGGAREASAPLPGALDGDGAWSVRFDRAGNAYAIGIAANAAGGSDVAVYRVSAAGALTSSATFHAADGSKAVAWDADGDLWITGWLDSGQQLPAPKMGLWKYSPATGLLTQTTTYLGAGTIAAGFGVRALDGAVYVDGFTSTAPLTAPSLNLALWKFDSQGHGPIAGPFLDTGYLSNVNSSVQAKLEVSSGTLYAAAQRTNAAGLNDLGLVRFDADGNILSDHYVTVQGAGLMPQAIGLDAQGNVAVAVTASGSFGTAYGVARFAKDGGSLGVASNSNAQGAVFGMAPLGKDLWLAVDGSTVPILFVGDQPIPAQDVVVSSAAVDSSAPVTALLASGAGVITGSATLPLGTTFTLSATDPPDAHGLSSGVAETLYWVDVDPFACDADFDPAQPAGTCANPVYSAPFQLAQGTHTLSFQSTDAVGNVEEMNAAALAVVADTIPPVTTLTIAGPLYVAADSSTFVSPVSSLTLTAVDPGLNASGVARTLLSLDGAALAASSGPFHLAEGAHRLRFFSVDNAGNAELAKSATIYADATPPVTSALIGRPQAQAADGLVVSGKTPIALSAADPVARGVAAGVDRSLLSVGSGPFAVYAGSVTLSAADGPVALSFYSVDRVANAEAPKSTAVVLDATPPALAFLSPAGCDGGICRVVKGLLPVFAGVSDAHLSSWTLAAGSVQVASGAADVSGLLGVADASKVSGAFALALSAQDIVANASSATLSLWSGDPGRLLAIGTHRTLRRPRGAAAAGGKLYVADTGDDQIKVYDSSGTFLAALGKRGRRIEPYFDSPRGVAADAAGNVYVADTNHHRVAKLGPDGALLWSAGASALRNGVRRFQPGKGPGQFRHPAGVALGPDGVYVADTDNRRVQVLDSSGTFVRQFSLPQVASSPDPDPDEDDSEDDGALRPLGKPAGIAVDAAGEVFIADVQGRRALKLDAQGRVLLALPDFARPEGAAVTPDGRCWLVSDEHRGTISKYDGAGNLTLVFGVPRRGDDADDDRDDRPLPAALVLDRPAGLALTADGLLLAADSGRDQLQGFGVPGPAPIVASGGPASDEAEVVASSVTRADGGRVMHPDKCGVTLPPNALAEDDQLTVSHVGQSDPDADRKKTEAVRVGKTAAAPAVEFGPEGLQFAVPVTLSLPYDPGLLAKAGLSEGALQVHYWNPALKTWEPLASSVDTARHVVTARTTHFSQYQVLAPAGSSLGAAAAASSTVDTAQVACNPLRSGCRPMAFQNLPAGARLRLYTLSGNLVKDLAADGSGTATWDGTNQDGQGVASGVYLLYAQGAGASRKLKVAVQR